MPGLSRRSFLLGSGAVAILAACGDDDTDAAPTTTRAPGSTTTPAESDGPILGSTFDRNGLLVAGIPQRAPFLLFEPGGGLVPFAETPAELTFELIAADGTSPAPVTVARHGEEVDRAYFPLVTTFESTGLHTARVEIDGAVLEYAVNVNDPASVAVPQVGAALPSADTPTVADPLGVQTVCTREPACPFHDVSLADALADGRPVALLVSTPAYCQVAICGPVLDLLIDTAPAYPDVTFVHLEVYPNGAPPGAPPSPLVSDPLGLTYEPALFVTAADGTVRARLDNIYDGSELDEALRGSTA